MAHQMVLPVGRSNGAAPRRPQPPPTPPPEPAPAPTPASAPADTPAPPTTAPPAVTPAPSAPGWMQPLSTAGVLVVATVAAFGSYEHMRALGEDVGAPHPELMPLSVDGLAVVASMTMLVRRWSGQSAGGLAWAALVLSLGVSLAANVAAAEPTFEAQAWAAWPPVGLLLAWELLLQQIKTRGGPGVHTARPGAHPEPLAHGGERT
jgi:uncharacterized protein DUF2637